MHIIKDGEKGRRDVIVNGDVSTIHHGTKQSKSEPEWQMTWLFDFKDISRDELIGLATKHLVIQHRLAFKKATNVKEGDWDNVVFSVREYLTRERRKVSQASVD